YIFLCKKLGKNIVLEESLVKSILKAYSSYAGDASSLTEISHKFSIPKIALSEILSILGFTHNDLPLLPEEIAAKDEDKIVEEILADKKFSIYQKLQKADWQETKRKAEKWDE